MDLTEGSKPISKSDDAAKGFVRESLGGGFTRGFDVDSIYCAVADGAITWTLIEFLKCDTYPPERSHPEKYWRGSAGNRKKFLSLWTLCQALRNPSWKMDARLLLVNYRDRDSPVKVMEVVEATDSAVRTHGDRVMTFDEWARWFQDLNDRKPGATWDALSLLAEARKAG